MLILANYRNYKNNFNRNENFKILNKAQEREKIKVKIDLLKDKYGKFEKGEIDADGFRDFIENVKNIFKS